MAHDIFISYRREGGMDIARQIQFLLENHGFTVFIDLESCNYSSWREKIKKGIENSKVFIFILSKKSLERCENEDDMVREEIEYAYKLRKEIIPINPDNEFKTFPVKCPALVREALEQHNFFEVFRGQHLKLTVNTLVEQRIRMIIESYQETSCYKIGDYYDYKGIQGVVFDVNENGKHGKLLSMHQVVIAWCTLLQYKAKVFIGALNEFDGYVNSNMIAQFGLDKYPALQWCRSEGADWYLPAVEELLMIHHNCDKINAALQKNNGDELSGLWYWSSTEDEEDGEKYALCVNIQTSNKKSFCKDVVANYARAIITF
ncbi:MAG: TIR domain-containing protein [Bacteroidaceae bacterium]|nr:TIR domain-containing protein [Bacteroidaceae bacterium]